MLEEQPSAAAARPQTRESDAYNAYIGIICSDLPQCRVAAAVECCSSNTVARVRESEPC